MCAVLCLKANAIDIYVPVRPFPHYVRSYVFSSCYTQHGVDSMYPRSPGSTSVRGMFMHGLLRLLHGVFCPEELEAWVERGVGGVLGVGVEANPHSI